MGFLLALLFMLHAQLSLAHPIVSTDVNRHVTIRISSDRLDVRYIYEMLEIEAIAAARAADADGDGHTSDAERDAYLQAWSDELLAHLTVRLDRSTMPLRLDGALWELGEGAFGLPTWKLIARLSAPLAHTAATARLEYRDDFRPNEVGWKEVMLQAQGDVQVENASVPPHDRSGELTDYAAMLDVPNPNETAATALVRLAPETVTAEPSGNGGRGKPSKKPARDARGPTAPTPLPDVLEPADKAGDRHTVAPGPPPHETAAAAPRARPKALWRHYAWPFFKLGMHHIATGYDHLLFLLGLLLFRQSLARLVAVVTAFTVAHSVTLAVAAAGWISPPGAAIELLIAASIAYVGAAALLTPYSKHGPLVALGFGLVHGFGFAGALERGAGRRGRTRMARCAGELQPRHRGVSGRPGGVCVPDSATMRSAVVVRSAKSAAVGAGALGRARVARRTAPRVTMTNRSAPSNGILRLHASHIRHWGAFGALT